MYTDCTPTTSYEQELVKWFKSHMWDSYTTTHTDMTIPLAYLYVKNKGSRLIKSDKYNKQTTKAIIYSGSNLKKK
jgi:hypothetical protein